MTYCSAFNCQSYAGLPGIALRLPVTFACYGVPYARTPCPQVDDPVSAFPLHAMCGTWGLLFTGLMAQEHYVYQVYGIAPGHHRMGLLYGGHAQLLLCQVCAREEGRLSVPARN